ncbi:MAG TPA: hypothetical protein PLL54_01120 [Dermatophilaceae bacterium]|nr:hypothetical protein [Dermatophilaceae bacterium]
MANRTALVALAARAAGMAGAFAMTVAITRSLSKPHAGLVLLTYTLLTVAATLARFGADNLALREVSKGGADRAALVRHSVGVALIGSPVAMALLAVALMAQGDGTTDPSLVLAACLAVFPAAMSIIAGAVLRGLSRLAAGMLAELGSPALLATVGIAALGLTGRSSATSAVWMLALGNAVTMVWSWWLIRRTLPEVRRRAAGFRVYLSTFRPALAAFFTTSIGFFLLAWLPVLVLGFAILDPTQANLEVARYNAAARLAQFVPLVSVIQISYLSQQFASLHHRGEIAAINALSQRATRQAALWAGGLTVGLCLLPEVALRLFGDYADAAGGVRILALGALLVVLAGPVNGLLLTCGHERQAGRYTLALVVASAVILPLVVRWGYEAVAVGSAVGSILYAVAGYLALRPSGIHAALPARSPAVAPTKGGRP